MTQLESTPRPRVALVTGGGRGIGRAISLRLAADGFTVAVNYSRSSADADATVAEITAAGGRAAAIQADVSDPEQAQALVDQTTAELGTPLVLVNNAGMNLAESVRKQSPEDWNRVLAVNLSGPFYCTHAALPGMYEHGWGRVIFFGSSAGGRKPSAGTAAYGAAKAGLVTFGKSLALEVARRGITANTVVPGFVETDIIASGGPDAVDALTKSWPRIPADALASTVSFLASDQAAYVSGEEIGVWNGGPIGV